MKNKGAIIVLTALALAALVGSGPCDEAQIDDDLSPLAQYQARLLHPGSVVDVFDRLAYLVGQELAPNGFFAQLNRIDNPVGPITTSIPGTAEGFDFTYCGTSGYVVILEIASFAGFDLATTAGWVNIRIAGHDLQVRVPTDTSGLIEAGQTLALYVASDGSTYYALNDTVIVDTNPRTHDMTSGLCDVAGFGCPSLTPALAYNPANLAAAAGPAPSATPLVIHGNSIDPAAGLNGGVLASLTNNEQVIAIAVEICPPNFGYDQLNNTTDFMVGGYSTLGGYVAGAPAYLDPNPYPLDYPNGAVFTPFDGTNLCDLNPSADYELILYIQPKNGTWLPDPIVVPFSTGPAPPGYTLNLCAP